MRSARSYRRRGVPDTAGVNGRCRPPQLVTITLAYLWAMYCGDEPQLDALMPSCRDGGFIFLIHGDR
jgi:hypothetical protein